MNYNLPTDSLTDKIGVNVVGDFDNFMQGGSHFPTTMVSTTPVPSVQTTGMSQWLQMMFMQEFLKNFGGMNGNFIHPLLNPAKSCLNKHNKSLKKEGDGENSDNRAATADGVTSAALDLAAQGDPLNFNLQYLKMILEAQKNFANMNKRGGAMPNNLMGMQPGMGMGMVPGLAPGVAMGQTGLRDAVSQHVGNQSGMRMVPSSLSTSMSDMSSAHTSVNLPISECTMNAARGKCRKPTCFREIPGAASSNCLPRRGVQQYNGMCPPQYNRGRGVSCVPKSEKQLRNLQKGNMAPAMPRPRGRPRKGVSPPRTMCAQVNDMAKQAQNDYVSANCQAPGCTIKQMKNGYLQCAKSRN